MINDADYERARTYARNSPGNGLYFLTLVIERYLERLFKHKGIA